MSDSVFWFILAAENLIASVLLVLYYRTYRKEVIALMMALTYFLYSAWFILVAGILKAPEGWQIGIGVALLGSFPMMLFVLIRRVLWGDDE